MRLTALNKDKSCNKQNKNACLRLLRFIRTSDNKYSKFNQDWSTEAGDVGSMDRLESIK